MRTLLIAAVAVAGLTGCSILFQPHVPSDWTPAEDPACSTNAGLIVTDLVVAGVGLVAAGIGAANASTTGSAGNASFNGPGVPVVIVAAPVVALGVISALVGRHWTGTCARARRQREVGGGQ